MDNRVIITSQNVKLVYSNRICCFDEKQLDFKCKLSEKTKDELKIRFQFKEDTSPKQKISMKTIKNEHIVIELTNFNNPLGAGLKKPIRIAKLNEKNIYILLNVHKYNESNPILDISLYMENDDAA